VSSLVQLGFRLCDWTPNDHNQEHVLDGQQINAQRGLLSRLGLKQEPQYTILFFALVGIFVSGSDHQRKRKRRGRGGVSVFRLGQGWRNPKTISSVTAGRTADAKRVHLAPRVCYRHPDWMDTVTNNSLRACVVGEWQDISTFVLS
jgi:hypothetical protein